MGNGSHLCTTVLMNMCNIMFQVLRLSTLSLTSVQKKSSHDYICGQERTVAQHYINIGPMYRVIWCSGARMLKRHQHNAAVRNTVQSPNAVSITVSVEDCGSTLKHNRLNATCLRNVYNRPCDRLVLGQRRRRLIDWH